MNHRAARTGGLLLGTALDALFGDPLRGHPVAGFGYIAQQLERVLWSDSRLAGAAYGVTCVSPVFALGLVAERVTRNGAVRMLAVSAATWAVLGGETLCREGEVLHDLLFDGDVAAARAQLGHLAGRDAANLDKAEIARAGVESVAENTSDAVVAPLFWGTIGGIPGLLGYRAINTLDAMVGYRSARYLRFGWFTARLDDVANLLPARLTAVLVAVCSGHPRTVWSVVARDAGRHPSPNSGWCESAYAGALNLRLGGVNIYQGQAERRPSLGDGAPAGVADLPRTVRLARRVIVAAALVAAAVSARTGR